MIVVTGAVGRLGGAVVTALLERLPADSIGVSTTRPDELATLSGRGVRVRHGSYDDPASLREAFAGADRLLIVSAPRHGAAAIDAHRAALDAARDAGVGRVFYTSHVGADALSPFPPAVTHATTEVLLRESGVPFTALRNGFYADTPLRLLRTAVQTGELRVPVDAPISWTAHRDLAPAIAMLLADPAVDTATVNLTAGEATDCAGLADVAAAVLDRPIRHVVLDDEDYRAELTAAGVPELGVTMMLGIFRASRQRHLGIVDPAMAALIGRPTTTVGALLAEELPADVRT
ncbi:NmrA family NAD(P)-binding protein [Nakamurella deserti]|uniref:NmrA family NAD(P)-binding protein n=1 Tax=Nakamurella deserti TaxID=2164074 RepID=UPI000DBE9378|nr:NmrA family NAD(P)-binding protein [Nakamurella deserti]